jgi:DNA-binding PadR family transcriptional regulator
MYELLRSKDSATGPILRFMATQPHTWFLPIDIWIHFNRLGDPNLKLHTSTIYDALEILLNAQLIEDTYSNNQRGLLHQYKITAYGWNIAEQLDT